MSFAGDDRGGGTKEAQRQYEAARNITSLFGGLLSGFIALFFFLAAPLFNVTLLPTATFPYGTVLSALHLVIWLLCIFCVLFPARALLTFAFVMHAAAAALDLALLIVLMTFAYGSIVSASSAALQYGFVLVPLVVQFVVGVFVSAALWRLVAAHAPARRPGQ